MLLLLPHIILIWEIDELVLSFFHSGDFEQLQGMFPDKPSFLIESALNNNSLEDAFDELLAIGN